MIVPTFLSYSCLLYTSLADVLAVEGLLASLRAKAAGLAEAIVADGDLSDLALAVQRQLHIHGACEALLLGGIAAVALFLHGRGCLLYTSRCV